MMKNIEVKGFFNEWRPLSNFWYAPVVFEDKMYNSSENAYQAAKTLDKDSKIPFFNCTPGQAKKLGQKLEIRKDWDQVKVAIMYHIVYSKFSHNLNLEELLLSTGNGYLEETNNWGDTFWGVCNGNGLNNLGEILMNVRYRLMMEHNYSRI
jgi:ribA/ribD-fused uncharacterized protein